jgi:phosphonate transport system permease protein
VSRRDDGSVVRALKLYLGFARVGDSPAERRLAELKRARFYSQLLKGVGALMFVVLFWLALGSVEFSIVEIVRYWPEFTEALGEYFPPGELFGVIPFVDLGEYWTFIQEENLIATVQTNGAGLAVWRWGVVPGKAFITLGMGFAGTVLGFPLALLLGILGSERVTPFPFNFLFRGIMSMVRAIPALIWVLIYIPLGGISPFTATLAIGTDTVGNLGRLFTDEIEEIDDGPIEGIQSTGATRPQVIIFGMLRQLLSPFIAWTLYILEINTRVAVTMGLVGGGGIGFTLLIQKRLFQFTNMMASILVILVLILSVELISQRVRSSLRNEESQPLWAHLLELLRTFPRRMIRTLRQ